MEKEESAYNMMDWWKKVFLKNYANFERIARRAEFWFFRLVNFSFYFLVFIIMSFSSAGDSDMFGSIAFMIILLVMLAMFIPALAVTVRRLHDLKKSGWNIFIYFVPFVGPIILLVWLFTDGDRFANEYGEDPKNPGIPELEFTGESH